MTKSKENQILDQMSIKKIGCKYMAIITAILLLIFVLGCVNTPKPVKEDTTTNKDIAAIVDGNIISISELDDRYESLPSQYKSVITKENLLQQLVSEMLLLNEAKKEKIEVSDDEVEEIIQGIITLNNITKAEFEENLNEQGMTYIEFTGLYKKQMMINKLINVSVSTKINVSDDEITKFYESNNALFSAKEGQIRVRHILVKDESEAKDILKKLDNGEDFQKLARQYSIDKGSAQLGGDLGFFGVGQMVKEFEDAAFNLKIGETSKIVKTQFGYHILKREPQVIGFTEAKEGIKLMIRNQKQEEFTREFILSLKSKSKVQILIGNNTSMVEKNQTSTIKELGGTFKEIGDNICSEGNKPIIRLFTIKDCSHCKWIQATFESSIKEFIQNGQIIAYNWELDTGDNLLTEEVENGIPKEELDLFKKINPKSTVPTFIFGCKYIRIGNAFEQEKNLNKEKEEFVAVINKLL